MIILGAGLGLNAPIFNVAGQGVFFHTEISELVNVADTAL